MVYDHQCGEIAVILGKYAMCVILSISFVFALVFTSSPSQHLVLAQKQTQLLKYEDKKLGLSFQYPNE